MEIMVIAGNAAESVTGVDDGIDVQFVLSLDGVEHSGEVTLLKDRDGDWWSWGSLDHWLDGRTVGLLRDLHGDERDDAICEIRNATSEAAKRFEAAS